MVPFAEGWFLWFWTYLCCLLLSLWRQSQMKSGSHNKCMNEASPTGSDAASPLALQGIPGRAGATGRDGPPGPRVSHVNTLSVLSWNNDMAEICILSQRFKIEFDFWQTSGDTSWSLWWKRYEIWSFGADAVADIGEFKKIVNPIYWAKNGYDVVMTKKCNLGFIFDISTINSITNNKKT